MNNNETKKTYELRITADEIKSTDPTFTMKNLSLGDNYQPKDAYFRTAEGEITRRNYGKNERKISNQTLPRLAIQMFEQSIVSLPESERATFPVCRYHSGDEIIRGIFPDVDSFKKKRKSIEFLIYKYNEDKQIVIYCWSIFSTLLFVQECLKRFGTSGDEFILVYKGKEKKEIRVGETQTMTNHLLKSYVLHLLKSKNLILRGAPGTGKTFLANEMAADVVSNGRTTQINELSEDEKSRIGFVQFHPSYDYTDFVEGLRPTTSDDGVVSFTLKDGSFKSFVEKAKKTKKVNGQDNFEEAWAKFFDAVTEASIEGEGYNKLKTLTGKPVRNLLAYERNEIQGVYPAKTNTYLNHDQIYNVYRGLPGTPKGGFDAYRKAIVKHLKEEFGLKNYTASTVDSTNNQNYVFIIDEINRGEISKIFGELFFSIDPGYRGHKEGVYTQYANLHENPEEKFYIPNNVYIIGTMNDIDRSVDTFDFAMRRRFTFLEIKAEDSAQNMLTQEKTKELMTRLNEAIVAKEKGGLSTDYQIGASYFLSIDNGEETMEQLWDTKLYPLLKDYFHGEHKAKEKLEILEKVYSNDGDLDEAETSTR
ncbi:TPA: AAA family ATPase [Enterococcus faecium]|nr:MULTISPECIES: AAA family ATPase [Enterococcus]AOM23579.1 endonuclease [Enterococcus faecium]AOM29581.1 endonuclease [Enterococcus faecium]AOM32525.1 endonuclease [Enterococcus faecium]APV52876.1 endonuclease [Enterococcus faecium]APV58773.1 endonuclease [Enterococcus faecium]